MNLECHGLQDCRKEGVLIHETLGRFWLFEHLGPEALAELAGRCREQKLPGNHPVFRLGEAAENFYLIAEGAVVLVRDSVARPVELLARLGPGDFFGEVELMAGRPRSTSVRTTEPTRLLVIGREPFLAFLGSQPLLRLRVERAAHERANARSSAAAVERSVRRDVRIPVGREVVLDLPGGPRVLCHLDNLSLGGVALEGAPKDWRIRKQVFFRLGLEEKPDLLDLSGVVTWRKGNKVGIAFRDPTPELRIAVSRALQELLPRKGEDERSPPTGSDGSRERGSRAVHKL